MGEQFGYIIYTAEDQVQREADDPELNLFLQRNRVKAFGALKNELSGCFTLAVSSPRPCHFFMSYACNNKYLAGYSPETKRIGVVGAKGKAEGITRNINNIELFLSTEEDLFGKDFFRPVFGTRYLNSADLIQMDEQQIIGHMKQQPSHSPAPSGGEETAKAHILLEEIWTTMAEDPSTRLVVLLPDAQQSEAILYEAYRLIPARLRLQNGFMTNAAQGDLDMVGQRRLPIYILTTEDGLIDQRKAYTFPVKFVDLRGTAADLEGKLSDEGRRRLSLIRKLYDKVSEDPRYVVRLDLAEADVLEAKKMRASSFKVYEDILGRAEEPLYWWEQEKKPLSGMLGVIEQQQPLLDDPSLQAESVNAFYRDYLVSDGNADWVLEVFDNDTYPDRAHILKVLSDSFHMEPALQAFGRVEDSLKTKFSEIQAQLQKEHEQELEEQKKQAELEKKSALDQAAQEVASAKSLLQQSEQKAADLSGRLTAATQRGDQLEAELTDASSRLAEAQRTSETASREAAEAKKSLQDVQMREGQLSAQLSAVQQQLSGSTRELDEARRTISRYEETIQSHEGRLEEDESTIASQKSTIAKLEKKAEGKGASKIPMIIGAAGIGIGVAGLVLALLANQAKNEINVQLSSTAERQRKVESELAAAQTEADATSALVEKIQSENDQLMSENEALKASAETEADPLMGQNTAGAGADSAAAGLAGVGAGGAAETAGNGTAAGADAAGVAGGTTAQSTGDGTGAGGTAQGADAAGAADGAAQGTDSAAAGTTLQTAGGAGTVDAAAPAGTDAAGAQQTGAAGHAVTVTQSGSGSYTVTRDGQNVAVY